jgi:hypothetical protein
MPFTICAITFEGETFFQNRFYHYKANEITNEFLRENLSDLCNKSGLFKKFCVLPIKIFKNSYFRTKI